MESYEQACLLEIKASSLIIRLMGKAKETYEKAANLFIKAGNMHKLERDFENAQKCFIRAAQCFQYADEYYDATRIASAAFEICLTIGNYDEAKKIIDNILEPCYINMGKYTSIGKIIYKYAHTVSETETDCVLYFERAKELFQKDDESILTWMSTCDCQKRIGLEFCKRGEYKSAMIAFEKYLDLLSKKDLNKELCTDIALTIIICALAAQDIISAKKYFDIFISKFKLWIFTKEYKLCKELFLAYEASDLNEFHNLHMNEYELIENDKIKAKLFQKIREIITLTSEDSFV